MDTADDDEKNMALSDQKFSCRTSDGRFGTVTDFDGTSGAALRPARVKIQVEGVLTVISNFTMEQMHLEL